MVTMKSPTNSKTVEMYYKASLACYFPIYFVGPQPVLRAIPAHIFPQGEIRRLKRLTTGGVRQRRTQCEPLLLPIVPGKVSFLEGSGTFVRTQGKTTVQNEVESRRLLGSNFFTL